MEIIEGIAELREALDDHRANGRRVGFAPTMGYLHDGHESLFERAVRDCDVAVASIFVNPLQFGVGEDLDAYPRDPHGDRERAQRCGIAYLFTPSVEEMYPRPILTTVSVRSLAAVMEGASRPTHFDGVATVVTKLLSIVGPCRAYFGEKDYQQLAIIRQLAFDLSLPVEIVGCPTIREDDGLARSSRNVYLSDAERAVAPVLHRALRHGADLIVGGQRDAEVVRRAMAEVIEAEPLGELDYVEVADGATLEPQLRCDLSSRLFGAVRFGRARLIDNVGIEGR